MQMMRRMRMSMMMRMRRMKRTKRMKTQNPSPCPLGRDRDACPRSRCQRKPNQFHKPARSSFLGPRTSKIRLHIEAGTIWRIFWRQYFQMHFLEWKLLNLIEISSIFFPKGLIENDILRIGPGNGLALNSWQAGGRFNIKMPSYQYRKPHCGDKTILRPSNLHNGISYTGKMASLYWIRTQLSEAMMTQFFYTFMCL